MRASKKVDRDLEKLMQLLASTGHVQQEEIENIKANVPLSQQAISRQGEAVLLFLEAPAKFTTKLCKRAECRQPFGTNYRGVAYCSDNCRARSMEELLGIKWNWFKQEEERWGGEPPLIIPPAALQKLQTYVEFFASIPHIQTETETLPDRVFRPEVLAEPEPFLELGPLEDSDTSQDNPPSKPRQSTPQQYGEGLNPFDFE